jgi:hypothetical protein
LIVVGDKSPTTNGLFSFAAGRGLQPRPPLRGGNVYSRCRTGFATPSPAPRGKHLLSGSKTLRSRLQTCSGKLAERNSRCRTGFATPSPAPRGKRLLSLPDGVCNPVRNILDSAKTLRSRLQTCSGKLAERNRCRTGFATPSPAPRGKRFLSGSKTPRQKP